MSDSKNVSNDIEDDDDDIFRSAFSDLAIDKGQACGKVKIDGNASHIAVGIEKSDPMKDGNLPRPQSHVHETDNRYASSFDPHLMRKANSVDTCPRFVTDEYSSSPEEIEDEDGGDKFIEIKVFEPTRIGEGMSSFLAYRIATRTNLKPFKQNDFSVVRRFSDFLGLHEKLSEKYARRGRIIPPAPEKSLMGTTKMKMSTSEETLNESEFVARRRLALERFINRVAQHPVLRRDSNFVEFLEARRDLPRATSTSAISSASVLRLLGRVGDTVNKMTYKMEETDPWYEEKIVQLDCLESQLKKLYTVADNLQQFRHELSVATGAFSQSVAALSSVEEAHSLSRALAHLSRVEEKVEQVNRAQAEADLFHFFDLIKDYVGLVAAVREALNERSKAFQAAQNAQQMVIRKKEQKARLEMGGRMDKLPMAQEDVVDWENRLEEAQANFQKISEVIKVEIDFFERYRVRDFKNSILRYLETLMECQAELVKHWEEFLPEVKNSLY